MYKEICIQVAGLVTRLGGDPHKLYEVEGEDAGIAENGFYSFIKAYIANILNLLANRYLPFYVVSRKNIQACFKKNNDIDIKRWQYVSEVM